MGRERYWDGQGWTDQSRKWEGKAGTSASSSNRTPSTPLRSRASAPSTKVSKPLTRTRDTGLSMPGPLAAVPPPARANAPVPAATAKPKLPALDEPGSRAVPALVMLVVLALTLASEAAVLVPAAYGLHLIWPFLGALIPFGVWLALALVLLVPGFRQLNVRLAYGAREPRHDERTRLQEAWLGLLPAHQAAGFHLMVSDTEDLNVCAPVGRVVIASASSVQSLPLARLQAVLAHELGHRTGLLAASAFVDAHLLLPSRALLWVLRALWSPVKPMWKRAVAWHRPIGFLLVLVLVLCGTAVTFITALPAALALGASAAARLAKGHTDARADAFVVRLGLGAELLAALEHRIENTSRPADSEHHPALPLHLVRRAQHIRQLMQATAPVRY